jgi:hypothetical protein
MQSTSVMFARSSGASNSATSSFGHSQVRGEILAFEQIREK